MKKLDRSVGFLGIVLGVMGCGSQVDGGYVGDVQATMRGSLSLTEGTSVAKPVDVFLMWTSTNASGEQTPDSQEKVEITRAPVEGVFPFGFTMDLTEPPSELSLLPAGTFVRSVEDLGIKLRDEANIGYAVVLALPTETVDFLESQGPLLDYSAFSDGEFQKSVDGALAGGSEEYAVVYVDRDVTEGSVSAGILGGALKKGYHLMTVEPEDDSGGGSPDEEYTCNGIAVPDCDSSLQAFLDWAAEHPDFTEEELEAFRATDRVRALSIADGQCEYDFARDNDCAETLTSLQFKPVAKGFETLVKIKAESVKAGAELDLDLPLDLK